MGKLLIIRNTSGGQVTYVGQRLEDGESFHIEQRNILRWRDDLTVSGSILSGDLTVSDGDADLPTPAKGLQYLLGIPDDFPAIVGNNFVTVTSGGGVVFLATDNPSLQSFVEDAMPAIVPGGDLTVVSGTSTITISGTTGGEASLVGTLHQIAFMKGEDTVDNDVFLNTYGDGRDGSPSNQSPAIMPWKSKLVGITYTNKKSGTKVHIEVCSVADGDGNSPVTMEFDWKLDTVGVRTARKTNFSTDVIFDAGDKIAVMFDLKGGTAPENVIVVLYFETLEETFEESSEDFNGNLGIPAGTS